MAQFSDLSNEVVLLLVPYLEPQPASVHTPTHRWVTTYEKNLSSTASCIADIRRLASCNHRLYALLRSFVYQDLIVRPRPYNDNEAPTILDIIQDMQEIKHQIRSLDFRQANERDLEIIFWKFPNLQQVTLGGFSDFDAFDWPTTSHTGTSSVEVLRLINCGGRSVALGQMLSWPKRLKELWIDADQTDWQMEPDDGDGSNWTCAAVMLALEFLVECPERFVFTRPVQDHEGLGYGNVVNIRELDQIKRLCVNHVFLVGFHSDVDVGTNLPESLEELDVFYDDAGYIGFLQDGMSDNTWLYNLLHKKGQCTPNLKRVRIVCLEGDDEDAGVSEDDMSYGDEQHSPQNNGDVAVAMPGAMSVTGIGADGSHWKPPRTMMATFIAAKVSFSIFLGPKRRFRHIVDGDEDFQNQWEDTWDPAEDNDYLGSPTWG